MRFWCRFLEICLLHAWKCSIPNWVGHGATWDCGKCLFLWQRVRSKWSLRSFLTPTSLWLCDSLKWIVSEEVGQSVIFWEPYCGESGDGATELKMWLQSWDGPDSAAEIEIFYAERTADADHCHGPKPELNSRFGGGSFWIVRCMKGLNTGIMGNSSGWVSPGGDSWHFHFYLHPLWCSRMVPSSVQNKYYSAHFCILQPLNSVRYWGKGCASRDPGAGGPWVLYPAKWLTGRQVCVWEGRERRPWSVLLQGICIPNNDELLQPCYRQRDVFTAQTAAVCAFNSKASQFRGQCVGGEVLSHDRLPSCLIWMKFGLKSPEMTRVVSVPWCVWFSLQQRRSHSGQVVQSALD